MGGKYLYANDDSRFELVFPESLLDFGYHHGELSSDRYSSGTYFGFRMITLIQVFREVRHAYLWDCCSEG